MKDLITIKIDDAGQIHLDVDDNVSWHEAIGMFHMMTKRIEFHLLHQESVSMAAIADRAEKVKDRIS